MTEDKVVAEDENSWKLFCKNVAVKVELRCQCQNSNDMIWLDQEVELWYFQSRLSTISIQSQGQ